MTTIERTHEEELILSAFYEHSAHEAGHAVVGHFAGLELDYIEVYQQRAGEGGGVAMFDHADPKEERSAIMYAAGGPAVAMLQRIYKRQRDRAKWGRDADPETHINTQWPDLSADDRRNLRNYLDANYFSGAANAKRETARIQNEARRQVHEYWPWIAKVMVALNEAMEDWQEGCRARIDRATFLKAIAAGDELNRQLLADPSIDPRY